MVEWNGIRLWRTVTGLTIDHVMTNIGPDPRESQTTNPYWDIVKKIPGDSLSAEFEKRWSPAAFGLGYDIATGDFGFSEERARRKDLAREYAWAIPAPRVLEWLVEQINGRPVVESGAGTGYWAWQLSQLGVDIVAYDAKPPDVDRNWFHSPKEKTWHVYTQEDQDRINEQWAPFVAAWEGMPEGEPPFEDEAKAPWGTAPKPPQLVLGDGEWVDSPQHTPREVFFPVVKADALAVPPFPDRILFLCWPPYDDPMALEALATYTGDTLIYIGERHDGCNASDAFFVALEMYWELVAEADGFVQWEGIHDGAYVYRRRGQ